jgi:hypothetical protein
VFAESTLTSQAANFDTNLEFGHGGIGCLFPNPSSVRFEFGLDDLEVQCLISVVQGEPINDHEFWTILIAEEENDRIEGHVGNATNVGEAVDSSFGVLALIMRTPELNLLARSEVRIIEDGRSQPFGIYDPVLIGSMENGVQRANVSQCNLFSSVQFISSCGAFIT